MTGQLNEMQIDNLLLRQGVGRIGCTDGKKPYIVPVTYVFDGKDIIGQTREGMKVDIMRNNSHICFEVDAVTNMSHWESVILFGTFQELKGKPAQKAREYLFKHMWPLLTNATIHPHEHGVTGNIDDSNRVKPIMYRIRIKEKSGRFEKQ